MLGYGPEATGHATKCRRPKERCSNFCPLRAPSDGGHCGLLQSRRPRSSYHDREQPHGHHEQAWERKQGVPELLQTGRIQGVVVQALWLQVSHTGSKGLEPYRFPRGLVSIDPRPARSGFPLSQLGARGVIYSEHRTVYLAIAGFTGANHLNPLLLV
jgi:hypothetical protein